MAGTITRRQNGGFLSLRDAMNQMLSDAFTTWPAQSVSDGGSTLPINVYEDGERYVLHVLAPMVDPNEIEVTAAEGVLTIVAKQKPAAQESWKPLWHEFSPVEFRRQLRLPVEFDPERIEASYEHGVLMLFVPKAEHVKPRAIKVNVGK